MVSAIQAAYLPDSMWLVYYKTYGGRSSNWPIVKFEKGTSSDRICRSGQNGGHVAGSIRSGNKGPRI
ncbi:hypothetical protein TNCT_381581 [Trichonephila clavata]|uniref:Uncharacterized protein n=1 Tax=Trichonephila clavata TaxID=2740835 RepID=A0A8X6IEH9_TRICU|nr:hypothetical protein TNCT_381581 [Trichonephila clavata]